MNRQRLRVALKLFAAVALLAASFLSAPAGLSDHAGQVDFEGTLEVHHGDDFVNKRASYAYFLVTSEGERIALDVGERAAEAQALAGDSVRVSGSLTGRALTVSALEGVTPAAGPTAGAQLVTGEKKVIILNVNFQNDTSEPWTLDLARQVVFTNPAPSTSTTKRSRLEWCRWPGRCARTGTCTAGTRFRSTTAHATTAPC